MQPSQQTNLRAFPLPQKALFPICRIHSHPQLQATVNPPSIFLICLFWTLKWNQTICGVFCIWLLFAFWGSSMGSKCQYPLSSLLLTRSLLSGYHTLSLQSLVDRHLGYFHSLLWPFVPSVSCLLICLILASWAARHLPAHLPDTRQLSLATHACSSAW